MMVDLSSPWGGEADGAFPDPMLTSLASFVGFFLQRLQQHKLPLVLSLEIITKGCMSLFSLADLLKASKCTRDKDR